MERDLAKTGVLKRTSCTCGNSCCCVKGVNRVDDRAGYSGQCFIKVITVSVTKAKSYVDYGRFTCLDSSIGNHSASDDRTIGSIESKRVNR